MSLKQSIKHILKLPTLSIRKIDAKMLLIKKNFTEGMQHFVSGLEQFRLWLVDVLSQRKLISLLESQLELERREKEMYRELYLKLLTPSENLEPAPSLKGFVNLHPKHIPWSQKRVLAEKKLRDREKNDTTS